MSRSQSKKNNLVNVSAVAASSFAGMMLAVPLAFALGNPANTVEAQNGQSSVVGSEADFAKYAFAFNQGYEAKATSMVGGSGVCTEATVGNPGSGSASAVSAVSESGSNGGTVATVASAPMYGGKGSWKQAPVQTAPKHHKHHYSSGDDKRWEAMMNSYNTYTSTVYNSSSVTNSNSNNTIGSHNSTSTNVKVEDAKGVVIGVSNDSTATQNTVTDSYNEDSYNTSTETTTTTINDSFNKETNTAINSGNTVTEVSNETTVEDSYNNEETTTTNTTNNTTTNTVTDSYNNETEIDVDLESHGHGHGPVPVLTESEA